MDRFSHNDKFLNIDEELSWCFFKQNGNPYVMQDMIKERYGKTKEETLGK